MTKKLCAPAHWVLNFLPWLVVGGMALSAVGSLGYIANRAVFPDEPSVIVVSTPSPVPSFVPVDITDFRLSSALRIVPGDRVSARGEMCNTTSQTLTWTFSLSIVSAETSDLTNRIDVANSQPTTMGPFECRPLMVNLDLALPKGRWRVSLVITVMGTQSLQMQRIPLETAPFEVI